MAWILVAVLAYLLYQSGVLASFVPSLAPPGYVAPPKAVTVAASPLVAQQLQQEAQLAGSSIQAGSAAATAGLKIAGASSSALSIVPVVGAAVSAIASILLAASQKRAAEAKNENQAVAAGLPGWDQAVAQIVAAFNNGSIDATGVLSLLATALQNFWNEVTPQIQPGRNGCHSGSACPGVSGVGGNITNEGGANYCSGDIGAACCVGCADLNLSTANMTWAVKQAQATGKLVPAFVQTVFASKYGGVNRAAYTVMFNPMVPTVSL